MTLYKLFSLYPAKIYLYTLHTMRWTIEWTGAHLSNVLMHECGIRSGGRSRVVYRKNWLLSACACNTRQQEKMRLTKSMRLTGSMRLIKSAKTR